MKDSTELDFVVSRHAHAAGHSQKEIVFILVAGSSTVKRLEQRQGFHKAVRYAKQVAQAGSVHSRLKRSLPKKHQAQQFEMGD